MRVSDNIKNVRTMGNLDRALELSNQLRQTIHRSNAAIANFRDRMNEMEVTEQRVLDMINNSHDERKK